MRPCVLLVCLLPLSALAADGALPPGWFLAGDTGWTVTRGSSCGAGTVLEARAGGGWSTAMQLLEAAPYRGRRVRLSATLATVNAVHAGLWMRVDAADPRTTLAIDTMQGRALEGTRGCARSEVVLDVPREAESIALGVVASGGRVELADPLLEVVDGSVKPTALAPGVAPGPPGLHPEELPTELADATGRIDAAWFNDAVVEDASARLYRRNPSRWSDRSGDQVVTVRGDALHVQLGATTGDFTWRRDQEAIVIAGPWGLQRKYDVAIRLSRDALDMTWGFYERHLVREDAPQVEPGCVRFRQYKNAVISPSDTMYVCGTPLTAQAPPVQTLVGLLLAGFRRVPLGHAPGVGGPALPQ